MCSFPIHAATIGGSLPLLKWLVDTHYCPINMTRTGNNTSGTSSSAPSDLAARAKEMPILSSKSRSILGISMSKTHIDITRYLVVDKHMSLFEMKDIKMALTCLEDALKRLGSIPSMDDNFIANREHVRNIEIVVGGDFPIGNAVARNEITTEAGRLRAPNERNGNVHNYDTTAAMRHLSQFEVVGGAAQLVVRSNSDNSEEGEQRGAEIDDIGDDETVTTVADAVRIEPKKLIAGFLLNTTRFE